jgi:hypothetical protein
MMGSIHCNILNAVEDEFKEKCRKKFGRHHGVIKKGITEAIQLWLANNKTIDETKKGKNYYG